MQNSSTPLLVVAAAFVAEDRRILMQKRHVGAVHGGLWEFPGGKVEPGEAPETALVREIDEELGIAVAGDDLHPIAFSSGFTAGKDAGRPLVILLYTCRSWIGEARCLDGAEVGWFPAEELCSLDMPPLDYPLADKLVGELRNNSL